MNFFQRLRQRREEKRRLRDLNKTASAFATLERLQTSGLLAWDAKQRRVLIAEPLAFIYMSKAETWQAFMQNLYLWTYYTACNEAWEAYMQKEELKAVRVAMAEREQVEVTADGKTQKQHSPNLTRDDIDRIRRARRAEIAQSDMKPPRVEGFEFFIIRDTTGAQPDIVAVGHYDPDTEQIEMATWQEVKLLLEQAESKKERN